MNQELIPREFTDIAELMAEFNGDLVAVSRDPRTEHNAMSLRNFVSSNPMVRTEYNRILSEKLQNSGLQISERILKMVKLQDYAFGNKEENIPPNIPYAISVSREISALIKEGKNQNVSGKAAVMLVSKEDASELLQAFIDS